MKKIVKPNFFKRLFAALMDGLFFAVSFLSISFFVMPHVLNWTMNYSGIKAILTRYQHASHLYIVMQENDKGKSDYIEVKDWTTKLDSSRTYITIQLDELNIVEPNYLLSHLQYYYTNFLTGKNIELPSDTQDYHFEPEKDYFVSPEYQNEITVDGVSYKQSEYYTNDFFKEKILENKEEYKLNEETGLFEYTGVDVDASKKYLKSKIYDARKHLYYSDFHVSYNRTLIIGDLIRYIPPYIIMFCIVYLLFPMIFKNGQTLGKITFSIGLVNKNGYKVTRPQILLRFLFFFMEITLFTFIVGFLNWASIATLGVGVTGLLIATLISKENRSLHDYVAGTMVCDIKKSVFFKNIDEEEQYVADVNKHVEDFHSKKVVDAHVIQVGSKVIESEEDIDKINEQSDT